MTPTLPERYRAVSHKNQTCSETIPLINTLLVLPICFFKILFLQFNHFLSLSLLSVFIQFQNQSVWSRFLYSILTFFFYLFFFLYLWKTEEKKTTEKNIPVFIYPSISLSPASLYFFFFCCCWCSFFSIYVHLKSEEEKVKRRKIQK